jgi:hypothetical protein
MNVQLSSRTDEWFTPIDVIERVYKALGCISLDPASCDLANTFIQAERFIGTDENGLTTPWGNPGTIFLNPPGGKIRNRSKAQLFWDRLMNEQFGDAIYMGFSLEQMQTTQRSVRSILDYPFCVPAKRISFVSPEGKKNSPCHSNVVVYVPGYVDRTDRFLDAFKTLGRCRS